jgi:hypothetical protein
MTITPRITTTIAAALALGLATSAPASARLNVQPAGPATAVTSQAHSNVIQMRGPSSTIVRATTPNSGFDWADAGIGAAGGVALSLIGLGGVRSASRHRTRRVGRSTPLIS